MSKIYLVYSKLIPLAEALCRLLTSLDTNISHFDCRYFAQNETKISQCLYFVDFYTQIKLYFKFKNFNLLHIIDNLTLDIL